jgi:hypothetical protein
VPELSFKTKICSTWIFHVDTHSESSRIDSMIIDLDFLGEKGKIMNWNDQKVTWDTGTIPMKNRGHD